MPVRPGPNVVARLLERYDLSREQLFRIYRGKEVEAMVLSDDRVRKIATLCREREYWKGRKEYFEQRRTVSGRAVSKANASAVRCARTERNCDTEVKELHAVLKKGLILLENHTSIRSKLQLDLGRSYALGDKKLTDEEVATKAAFVGCYDEYKIYPGDSVDMQDCFVLLKHEVDTTTSVRHYLEGSSLFAEEA